STDWPPLCYILLILRITGLILMISIIAVVSTRTRGKPLHNQQNLLQKMYR
ncbi:hypothetical protein CHARACLAT_033618, partial [Characodon lateralis]|nr:hypothetical protein [Characodon lateralis]